MHPPTGKTAMALGATPRCIDAARLPDMVFGARNLASWATTGFMIIEGTTLAIALVAYLYVRRNFPEWPPPPTPLPDLTVPTLNTVLLLLVMVPMVLVARAARRFDLVSVRHAMLAATALSAATVALRVLEFDALNTRWDSHAYGSVAWLVVGLHTTLLFVDFVESATITALTFSDRIQRKHFGDVEDAALYQCFLSLTWLPIYGLVFLGPRWL
jgi:heme/copper-type cytochrome/quinol oxidase subunit 3